MQYEVSRLNNIQNLMKLGEDISEYIQYIGDCPNIKMNVHDNLLLWGTTKEIDGWQLQEHKMYKAARVLDDKGDRVAYGSFPVMREKMKRLMRKDFPEYGDILGVSRGIPAIKLGLYEHYAVYIGNNQVIHYAGEGEDFDGRITIHTASMTEFLKGSTEYFVVYFPDDVSVPKKIHSETTFLFDSDMDIYVEDFLENSHRLYDAGETVERAYSRIGEEEYNLVTNNCEHFAIWCKTGLSESSQVKKVSRRVGIRDINLLVEENGTS